MSTQALNGVNLFEHQNEHKVVAHRTITIEELINFLVGTQRVDTNRIIVTSFLLSKYGLLFSRSSHMSHVARLKWYQHLLLLAGYLYQRQFRKNCFHIVHIFYLNFSVDDNNYFNSTLHFL